MQNKCLRRREKPRGIEKNRDRGLKSDYSGIHPTEGADRIETEGFFGCSGRKGRNRDNKIESSQMGLKWEDLTGLK